MISISQKQKGYIVANALAFFIISVNRLLHTQAFGTQAANTLIFSQFVIIPILMGIVSAWYWRNMHLGRWALTANCCYNGLIAILLSGILLGEGFICLIIASPLILTFIITGAFIGRAMFKKNDPTVNVSVIGLLALVFVVDAASDHNYKNEVSDQLIVHAPPAKVWQNVVSFKRIQQPNKYWLFQIGMPSPVEATVTGHYAGAGRKCIFSNNYVFDEKIVTYDKEHNLTFDITKQPRDPEIMGHIDILRGQFILKDNHNGTTTLIGNSWYRLYVFPLWYYDVWAQSITRNVHTRVMEHIKQLSEAK